MLKPSTQLATMGKGKRVKASSGLSSDKTIRLVKLVLKNKLKVN